MTSSHPGLDELVEVMDRLRSPGGCPWDAEQTHESLAPYAVEEVHELVDAIVAGDRAELREELGDVLLQVVFHSRVAQDHPDDPFDIDDVAHGIAAKLRRRHPHVFAGVAVSGAAEVEGNWEQIKAAEKPERTGPLDGIPRSLPPLERASKIASRLRRTAVGDGPHARQAADLRTDLENSANGDDLGARLLALVLEADAAGVDPALALAAQLRAVLPMDSRPARG